LFPATHYSEGIGTNDVGKSSIGYTFEYTGYRVIKGTEISGANYNRVLGSNEPAQCTIIEDEGDSISEDSGKVRILKSGYEYNGKIPKINMNSKNQEQKWFKTFCYKMILAEKSLSQSKAKGLIDRTFSFHCRPGKVNHSIKEVVSENINKNPKLQTLYDELLNYRKLMLCYRLVHYKDSLVEIETGLKNRDNELCKPLLQLFYGTNALKEIIKTLEVFVNQRKQRKLNSIEVVLYPILKSMLHQDGNNQTLVYFSDIWKTIIEGVIDGNNDEKKPNQYETVDYGILYKNTLSKLIADRFGAKLNRKANGSILIFDLEKLRRFDELYDESGNNNQLTNTVKIEVKLLEESEKGDYTYNGNKNDVGNEGTYRNDEGSCAGNVGNVGDEGIRECVNTNKNNNNIVLEKSNKHNFIPKNDISINENNDNNTHLLKPTLPTCLHFPSSMPTLLSIEPTHPTFLEKYTAFDNSLISKSDLETGGYDYDPDIINNIDRFRGTDHWFCKNCPTKGDKWFMMKHPCYKKNCINGNGYETKDQYFWK
jgi:hypothetical protein